MMGRLVWTWGFLVLAVACRAPADSTKEPPPVEEQPAPTELPGVDTSALTQGEVAKWSRYVSELLAPCPDQPVSIAQCVGEARKCEACLPAARFLAERVRRGDARSQAEKAFKARFSPETVQSVDLGDSPARGAQSPVVTVVEWADFQCPHCALVTPMLVDLVQKRSSNVRLVFKHYPLSGHQNADKAARAAVAAHRQGKFWEMEKSLFAAQSQGLEEPQIVELARELSLDMKRFEADRASESAADAVAADRKQADRLGLAGTPMIYVNGRYFDFEHFDVREDLDAWIDLEIELRTGKSASAAPAQKPEAQALEAAQAPAAGQ
jgi:protein-disulfide isomerase